MTSGWPPAHCTLPRPATSRGPMACDFIERYCRVTKDSVGGRMGDLIVLRPWQKRLLNSLLATNDGKLLHRQALIGMPRKNAKSTLLAGLVLWQLVAGPAGGEIFSIAGDRDQAAIVHEAVKAMIRMDPDLSDLLRVQRDVIVNDSTATVYVKRSSDARLSEGYNPTFVVADEVHVMEREAWDAMALGSGARHEPLMVGITTAGVKTDRYGKDSLAYGLYQYGKRVAAGEIDDPSFFFAWWEAPAEANITDEAAWDVANPGLGDIVSLEDLRSMVKRTPAPEFATKRLNQWVATANAWLPNGAWQACGEDREIVPGERVVFGFDGSRVSDCTAIVLATVEPRPHLKVLGLWEPLETGKRVRSDEVMPIMRELADEWHPEEIDVDPSFWRDDLEDLSDDGYPVVEIGQRQHMSQYSQQFYEAVVNQRISHDGDARLARHLANVVARIDAAGTRIAKESKTSNRKIDLATAAVMAYARASYLANGEQESEGDLVVSLADVAGKMTADRRQELMDEHLAMVERVRKMAEAA